MATPIKDFLEKFFAKNEYIKGLIEALKVGGMKGLFTGDSLHQMVHKMAAILIAIKNAKGWDDEEIATAAAEWLDKKIELPMPLEWVDGVIFKYLIKTAIGYLENEGSEDTETQALVADAMQAFEEGDFEFV